MSYTRRDVKDGETIMNKDLYDNLQDGIDEVKEELKNRPANVVLDATVDE